MQSGLNILNLCLMAVLLTAAAMLVVQTPSPAHLDLAPELSRTIASAALWPAP